MATSPLPGCESLWQETLRMADFDPEALAHERDRNARPAYGLTLVASYPLPEEILAGVERLRQICRQALGGRVTLYDADHLHLTIYSLLRSRPVPLSGEELEATWSRWLPRLEELAVGFPPLEVPLRGMSVAGNGAVLVCGAATDGLARLQRQVSQIPGVAARRDIPPHVTIGQVRRPCGSADAFARAMAALRGQAAAPVGTLRVDELVMLYYRSRLLDGVIQSAVVALQRRR
ncbi:MAG: 2'-5' RNA ligase family protein [Anaerolineae bacterium]|nr:MAG: 2'-5' RNA ligase family protein [Anaerolineae bacterium]